MNPIRKRRLEGEILKTISVMLINGEVKDPLLAEHMLTVFSTKLADDLSNCKVYISAFTDEESERKRIKRGLIRAAGYMQFRIGRNLRMRRSPKLFFIIDESLKLGDEMADLLDSHQAETSPGEEVQEYSDKDEKEASQ